MCVLAGYGSMLGVSLWLRNKSIDDTNKSGYEWAEAKNKRAGIYGLDMKWTRNPCQLYIWCTVSGLRTVFRPLLLYTGLHPSKANFVPDWAVVYITLFDGFRKHDATSKTTWKWRRNGAIFPYMDVASHFHVVLDVASCYLNRVGTDTNTDERIKPGWGDKTRMGG